MIALPILRLVKQALKSSVSLRGLFFKSSLFLAGCFCFLLLSACGAENSLQLQGETMGTTWHVTLTEQPQTRSMESLQRGLEDTFIRVNALMSTWQVDSELSRFNQSTSKDWVYVWPDVAKVVAIALQLSTESEGAYDITVGPLVNLWGFGPGEHAGDSIAPSPDAIQAALKRVGYMKLQVTEHPPALRKSQPDLYVDLSSIAKGYGVDQARQYLESQGIRHGMVEVGGEVTTWGKSARGDEWRIAIEQPNDTGRVVQQGVKLTNQGLATSGDYRNFFKQNGKRYSHTIDPKTGYPVDNVLASVSVIAENTMLADGYATLLMALGLERARTFAQKHQLAAYFIWRTDQGFASEASAAFKPYLIQEQ